MWLILCTPSRRLLPSHGRGHWFNPSRAHHFTLCIQRPVAVVPDCISQEFLFGTSVAHGGIFMATIRRRNGRYHVQIRRKGFSPITSTFSRLTVARRPDPSFRSLRFRRVSTQVAGSGASRLLWALLARTQGLCLLEPTVQSPANRSFLFEQPVSIFSFESQHVKSRVGSCLNKRRS